MQLEKIFSTNHSCLNDTKSVYLFQTLTVYPIYPIYEENFVNKGYYRKKVTKIYVKHLKRNNQSDFT